jgi:hypothetical protein
LGDPDEQEGFFLGHVGGEGAVNVRLQRSGHCFFSFG